MLMLEDGIVQDDYLRAPGKFRVLREVDPGVSFERAASTSRSEWSWSFPQLSQRYRRNHGSIRIHVLRCVRLRWSMPHGQAENRLCMARPIRMSWAPLAKLYGL